MKIALLYSFKESSWFSCTKIVKNLLDSYDLAFKDDEILRLNYSDTLSASESLELRGKILEEKPDKLVFLDHRPHPVYLLNSIFRVNTKYNPEIDFHIFGDFTLMFSQWMGIDRLLKDKKVRFFCASDAQVSLVKKFFDNENQYIKKIPFPVSSKEFFHKENSNCKIREELSIEGDATVLLYTGRLSLQKKTLDLLDKFDQAINNGLIPDDTYLLLAGEFDSLGFSFGDVYHHFGEFFRSFDRKLNNLSKKTRERIKYLGKVDNKLLNNYYNTANVYVSFSTYHDEDYGMSVAEAGIAGMPLLLTDWAGFKSFNRGEYCELIPTKLGRFEPEIYKDIALEKLVKVVTEYKTFDRKKISQDFIDNNSVEAVANLLGKYSKEVATPFNGFNPFLYRISRVSMLEQHTFFDPNSKSLNQYYYEVYDVYASENK